MIIVIVIIVGEDPIVGVMLIIVSIVPNKTILSPIISDFG